MNVPSAPTASPLQVVPFRLEAWRGAVELRSVVRVLPMVRIDVVPGAPEPVAGAFNFHGEVVPVIDLRRRFGLAPREQRVSDHLLVLQTARRRLALAVDAVEAVADTAVDQVAPAEQVSEKLRGLRGIAILRDLGLVYLHDIEAFLSAAEERQLDAAMAATP